MSCEYKIFVQISKLDSSLTALLNLFLSRVSILAHLTYRAVSLKNLNAVILQEPILEDFALQHM